MIGMAGLGIGAQQLAIGLATAAATLAGGGLALRLGGQKTWLVGFGCGAIIGVALSDLLPEALELGRRLYAPLVLTGTMGAGFLAYLLTDRLTDLLGRRGRQLGAHLGPASLVLHSLMDGLAIGVAFAVSAPAGLVVSVAVVAHDLMDGANTITVSFSRHLHRRLARRWLVADALAPLVGIALSHAVRPSTGLAALLLAAFAGLFLYIGAAELLPRSRGGSLGLSGAIATVLGAGAILAAVLLSR